MTALQFNKKINQKFNQDFIVLTYTNMKSPAEIKCQTCGTIYNIERAENFLRRKYGCKKCTDTPEWKRQKQNFLRWLSTSDFILVDDLNQIHNSQQHIKCQCKKCGRIQQNKTIYDYYAGKKCYCQTKSTKKPEDVLKQDFANICIFLEEYKNTDTPILVESLKCHHQFIARPQELLRNPFQCPICNSSIGEKHILYWLEEKQISYYRQYKICNKYKVDFFLPQNNLFIEYNGIQHYYPVKFFGGQETLAKQQQRDNFIREYCKQNNIKLLEISYLDLKNIERILETEVGGMSL